MHLTREQALLFTKRTREELEERGVIRPKGVDDTMIPVRCEKCPEGKLEVPREQIATAPRVCQQCQV